METNGNNFQLYIMIGFLITLFSSISIIRQGTVGVSVLFGKYRRILTAGLNFRVPFFESVFKKISLQNRSIELEFQAITSDQANVNFKALIIYSVHNSSEEAIVRAAFKFIDEKSFMQALIRSIEGSIRSFVAVKKTK
jgi:regulator of protease activity HflC (stomatin/prohibitin superfamily)